jgi:hypothetical protein
MGQPISRKPVPTLTVLAKADGSDEGFNCQRTSQVGISNTSGSSRTFTIYVKSAAPGAVWRPATNSSGGITLTVAAGSTQGISADLFYAHFVQARPDVDVTIEYMGKS